MTLNELFKQAKIKKVAIIDDDLRSTITQSDISQSSPNDDDLNSLSDAGDPDNIQFIEFLQSEHLPSATVEQKLAALESEDVRRRAPERYRLAAQRALAMREDFAARVNLVKTWILDAGIRPVNLKIFTTPQAVPVADFFDLILVDYFLVNSSKKQTIPLIERVLEAHESQARPLLVILMSSHGAELSSDFGKLRSDLQRTSSRFRLMLKPSLGSEIDKSNWHFTFEQLAIERSVIVPIEKFITAWINKLNAATKELTNGLWSLDAHSLSILAKSANADHLSMEEYFGDVISRRVLAEVEHIEFPESETEKLTKALSSISGESFSSEIGDSRAALRRIVVDIAWHRNNWWKPKKAFPKLDNAKQFEWLKRNIRFGTVLRHKQNKSYCVNITQPCDIAHVDIKDIRLNHLLLIPGTEDALHGVSPKGGKFAYSYSFDNGNGCTNIQWSLRQPRTPSIGEFIEEIKRYDFVGQMRQDQAQEVAAQFASLSSRVGTIRTPTFGKFYGYVFGLNTAVADPIWEIKSTLLSAHTHPSGDKNKQKVVFDLPNAQRVLNNLGAIPEAEKVIRGLVIGNDIKFEGGITSIINNRLRCALATSPLNMDEIQTHPDLVKHKTDAAGGCHYLLLWPDPK